MDAESIKRQYIMFVYLEMLLNLHLFACYYICAERLIFWFHYNE